MEPAVRSWKYARDAGCRINISNDDGDGNKNGKKAIGGDYRTTTFSPASRFLYSSLPSLHFYDVKPPSFPSYGRCEHKTT